VTRNFPGAVTLTGTAGAGDKVEVRSLKDPADSSTVLPADYSTVLGTVTADEAGKWSLKLDNVASTTTVKAWLAGTFGGADVASAPAKIEVTAIKPTVNNAKRSGVGPATLTGKAQPGEKIQVQTLTGSTWTTVPGTASTTSKGTWALRIDRVAERTTVRAVIVGQPAGVSANAVIDVSFAAAFSVSTKGGYTYATVVLNPVQAGVPVTFQTKNSRGAWVNITRLSTNSKGAVTLKWNTAAGRTYAVRAVVSSTAKVSGAVTAAKSIKSS
jgi:hypothetical protein